MKTKPINNLLERVHLKLMIENPEYRALLQAGDDTQAVEGSLFADNIVAAMMIRDQAKKEGSPVAEEKLKTILRALGVVLRRYAAPGAKKPGAPDDEPLHS